MVSHRTALACCFFLLALYALALGWILLGAPCVWNGELIAALAAR